MTVKKGDDDNRSKTFQPDFFGCCFQAKREKEGEQHPADRKTKEQRQKEAKTEGRTVTGREGRSVEIPN